ncbi:SrfA family protein [Achromobacter aloeverae]
MPGVKLCSGRVDQFDALGERGQPVYQAASQILSTLKRRDANLARHFAIPQPSADGSVIDWYAPNPGSVVPWNAATEEERSVAVSRLAEVRRDVDQLRVSLEAKAEGESRFAQLLKWVLHHPDPGHVYLVDGQPVIAFWGFLNAGADRALAPLHALRPSTPVPASPPFGEVIRVPSSSVPEPSAVGPLTRPWWRRWWLWLLPLLLLLALLLFGLRACMPWAPGVPALPDVSSPDANLPNAARAPTALAASTGPLATVSGDGVGNTSPVSGAVAPSTRGPAEQGSDGGPAMPPLATATAAAPALDTPAKADPAASVTSPPDIPSPAASGGTDGPPIPPGARDGTADFLNGDWRVRAGIQDRDTGLPLRLQYQFKNGQGNVTLVRRNGVKCQAPVSAAMAGGALRIDNGAPATCSDGSTYDMPAIRCKPGANQVASCEGNYGVEQFPLTMRQPQP